MSRNQRSISVRENTYARLRGASAARLTSIPALLETIIGDPAEWDAVAARINGAKGAGKAER